MEKEKPFEIKNDFFTNLIEEEEKNFEGVKNKNGLFIEHEVVKTELNGYFTKSPIGKVAKSVKSYIYLSAGLERAMEMAEKGNRKSFCPHPFEVRHFVSGGF